MMNATKEFQIMMSPGRARLLPVIVLAGMFGGYVGSAIHGGQAGAVDWLLTFLKLAGLIGAILLFLSNYGQMSQRAESQLDEREAQIRNRAFVLTHQIMVATLFFTFFYVEIADKLGWWLPNASDAAGLITGFALGSMALPAAILAWRDQGLPED